MLQLILLRSVVMTALKVTIVVGTILALINHGPALWAFFVDEGHSGKTPLSTGQMLQIALTYVVPYCVSTYSSVKMLQKTNPD